MLNQRKPTDTDFILDVEGVGSFRFAKKTYGDHIQMRAEQSRIVGANPGDDRELVGHGMIVSHYKVLMVTCPAGWEDIEAMDMTEKPEIEQQIMDVHFALREKLDSFREPRKSAAISESAGEAGLPDDGVLVSTAVPASAS